MLDILIQDIDHEPDAVLSGNDVVTIQTAQNMVRLALFGGNKAQSTGNSLTGENMDYWANNLLFNGDPAVQFNSETERLLDNVALNSQGRVLIQNAIKKDLEFFKAFGTVKNVTITIVSDDRINATIEYEQKINEPIIIVAKFKKQSSGDWSLEDFDLNDFYFG